MSDKSEEQLNGRKPAASDRDEVETDGAFGNNSDPKIFSDEERNVDKANVPK